MSTRYDLVTAACEHCGRGDEAIEICTSMTMWRGVFVAPDFDAPAERPQIITVAQWLTRLEALERDGARIVDEYGADITVRDFEVAATRVPMDNRRRQYDWRLTHPYPLSIPLAVEPRGYWLDPDGYTFTGGLLRHTPL